VQARSSAPLLEPMRLSVFFCSHLAWLGCSGCEDVMGFLMVHMQAVIISMILTGCLANSQNKIT